MSTCGVAPCLVLIAQCVFMFYVHPYGYRPCFVLTVSLMFHVQPCGYRPCLVLNAQCVFMFYDHPYGYRHLLHDHRVFNVPCPPLWLSTRLVFIVSLMFYVHPCGCRPRSLLPETLPSLTVFIFFQTLCDV